MKKLLLLLPLCLIGCSNGRQHYVYCQDTKTKTVTYDGYSYGPVYASVIKGHSILYFRTIAGKMVIMYLRDNDCGVN